MFVQTPLHHHEKTQISLCDIKKTNPIIVLASHEQIHINQSSMNICIYIKLSEQQEQWKVRKKNKCLCYNCAIIYYDGRIVVSMPHNDCTHLLRQLHHLFNVSLSVCESGCAVTGALFYFN